MFRFQPWLATTRMRARVRPTRILRISITIGGYGHTGHFTLGNTGGYGSTGYFPVKILAGTGVRGISRSKYWQMRVVLGSFHITILPVPELASIQVRVILSG